MSDGRIVSLHICTGHFEPMDDVGSVNMLAGFGIEGDRHATDSPSRKHRQVLLMDEETLDVFGLKQGEVRENVTTSGIDIHSLPKGQRLSLGDQVVLEITGFCDPCQFIEDKEPGLRDRMTDRRGMLTHVVEGGVVNAGDSVKPL